MSAEKLDELPEEALRVGLEAALTMLRIGNDAVIGHSLSIPECVERRSDDEERQAFCAAAAALSEMGLLDEELRP